LNRDEFAASLNVSRRTLQRYELGEGQPDALFLRTICDRYGINPGWLLLGDEPMRKTDSPYRIVMDDAPDSAPTIMESVTLEIVIRKLEEHLEQQEIYLPPAKKARIIIALYEIIGEEMPPGDEAARDKKLAKMLRLVV
jgi:transcriptional regulator with XRE-family HTH domain